MSKNFNATGGSGNIKSKTELRGNEYGKAAKGLIICNVCHDVFFKKGWHKPGSAPIQGMVSGKGVHFDLCPACKMKKGGLFGGKINIKNIPAQAREDLFNLISGFGKRAELRNPQDRIIDIKTSSGNFIVTTNNDELAEKLGKKIHESFKKTDIKISFTGEPQAVSKVDINF